MPKYTLHDTLRDKWSPRVFTDRDAAEHERQLLVDCGLDAERLELVRASADGGDDGREA